MTARRLQLPALVLISICLFGCASVNRQVRGALLGAPDTQARPLAAARFSEQENLRVPSDRQYKRMSRERFEEEADVKESAGSLWVMEGQGAYLFAQNQTRMIGDLLNVKIEGGPRNQLNTKTRVIAKLLERLDSPNRGLASTQGGNQQSSANPARAGAGAPAGGQQAQGQPGAGQEGANSASAANAAGSPNGENQAGKNDGPFNVEVVPTRIVEQLRDGSYRVRGIQPFMIGKREYKVIVTGVVRPEDFDDSGISADRLLDPQFDIVSSRKGASL